MASTLVSYNYTYNHPIGQVAIPGPISKIRPGNLPQAVMRKCLCTADTPNITQSVDRQIRSRGVQGWVTVWQM